MRHTLPNRKERAYVVNVDGYDSVGTHWVALCVNGDKVTYFDSFRVEYIPNEFIDNKNITTDIYRIQAYNSIVYEHFCKKSWKHCAVDIILDLNGEKIVETF